MIRKAVGPDLASIRDFAQPAYARYAERIGRKPAPMVADFATLIDNGFVDVDAG